MNAKTTRFSKSDMQQNEKPNRPDFRADIRQAIETMRHGGVILYPTDTVWGIGCDATNPDAVSRIYEIKRRAESKAMIVLVDSMQRLERYVNEVPDIAWQLTEVADRPLTIIYDGARALASNLIADDGSIAIRITDEPFSNALCAAMRLPIVSTSANISGHPTPPCFAEIDEEIRQAVDFIVRYRQDDNAHPSPSSIIKLGLHGEVKVIR